MDTKRIGRQIRTLRKKLGMSQEVLAEAVGCSPGFISRIERGRSNFSAHILFSIAAALDTTVDRLLNGLQPTDTAAFYQEVHELLVDCSMCEKQVILNVALELKRNLRENHWAA